MPYMLTGIMKDWCGGTQNSMQYYQTILNLLEQYFSDKNWKKLFLSGGCYWLADLLHQGIDGSVIMINRIEEHCALYFEHGLYDVRGRISAKNFHEAGEREIRFMKKNYRPKFDTDRVVQYLTCCLPREELLRSR